MVQLTLPKNSQVNKNGKKFSAPAGAKNVRRFDVYRYDPDSSESPRIDSYDVDIDGVSMVLDGLIRIKKRHGSIARFSPLLPRRGLWILRLQHQWFKHPRLHQIHG